ncbi:hypothetical protein [Zunongwangia sp.]|uniref:hypothetical protein n=1 Tax=Zunongwangia sp. TaxID=1965325 RepID=UPI003AA928A0
MAQDIRELMKKDREQQKHPPLPKGHEQRFIAKLEQELSRNKKQNNKQRLVQYFLSVAAIFTVAMAVGAFLYYQTDPLEIEGTPQVSNTSKDINSTSEKNSTETAQFRLSNVSPQYKKVEDYYMGSLNVSLAKLEITPENKELVDSFMLQMSELDKEYKRLNEEFKTVGPNEQTVEAMISNLQLRLKLFSKLNQKLKEIHSSRKKDYENTEA